MSILFWLLWILTIQCGFVVSPRGKFKKDSGGSDANDNFAGVDTKAHEEERGLRQQASIIVVVIFLFVTIGMFFCCRTIPELFMEKCNVFI